MEGEGYVSHKSWHEVRDLLTLCVVDWACRERTAERLRNRRGKPVCEQLSMTHVSEASPSAGEEVVVGRALDSELLRGARVYC